MKPALTASRWPEYSQNPCGRVAIRKVLIGRGTYTLLRVRPKYQEKLLAALEEIARTLPAPATQENVRAHARAHLMLAAYLWRVYRPNGWRRVFWFAWNPFFDMTDADRVGHAELALRFPRLPRPPLWQRKPVHVLPTSG